MNGIENILNKFPPELQKDILSLPREIRKQIEEIRIKVGYPIFITASGKEYQFVSNPIENMMIDHIFHSILNHSAYAYQEELSKGYITIQGGHRVGVCGSTVIENGKVKGIKDISSLNIRRSREFIGISDKLIPYIIDENNRLLHTIIISPPMCGKTTLLRDIIRNLSKRGLRVGVCDERSEIAGCFQGVPSFDLGPRTDVLDACPKDEGMVMLIRAMSPDVIATDEIGKKSDIYGIETALYAGVSLLTTIHGKDYDDALKSGIGKLVADNIFKRYIVLSNNPSIGTVSKIYAENNRRIG
jgi:stage III sporulation protein AA